MDTQRLYELEHMPVGKLLWKYSLPAIVGMVVMSLYNVVDRIFIGQGVGPDAIAGLAITFPVMNLTTALGVLVGGGASARTSIVLGQNNRRKAELILGNSLFMTLVLGALYLSVFAIFIDQILLAFGASERSLPYARDYMLWMMPGMLMTNLSFSFNNIMRSSGYPTKAMITMFIGAGVNIVLDPVFIFVLKWGITGAAIATDIAMFVSMVFVMWHFTNKESLVHFQRGIYRPKLDVILSIVSIGAAPFLVNAAGCVINAIVNNTLFTYGGDSAVAAMGIFTTYAQLLVTFIIGLCMGMQPIVGFNYGAGHYHRLKRAYWLSVAVATFVTTAGCIVAHFWPEAIARAFTADDALIGVTARALRIATMMFWVVGFQIVSTNFFQSLGYAGKSIFMSLSRQVLFLIPLLLTLPSIYDLQGVWMSFPASDTIATLLTVVLAVMQFRKINQLQAEKEKNIE